MGKNFGATGILCIGGELAPAHLLGILPDPGSLRSVTVTWDGAVHAVNQSSFDFVVMDFCDPSHDRQREEILGMLPASTVVLMIPRFETNNKLPENAPSDSEAIQRLSTPVTAAS